MTEKEAIYILRNAAWLGSDADRQKVEEAVEVVANAIEALNHSEIPNSSDCIDRAEAQTAIQFAARRYTVAHEAHGEGHVVWSDNLISVTDAMNALREVPSAQPEPKWIPATKRLPKIGEEVLLSEPNEMFIAEYHGSGNAEGLWVVDACHHYLADVNKCAWMPLPKSYMRGEQE